VDDSSVVAVCEQTQKLPHDGCSCGFVEVFLALQYGCQRLSALVLEDYEEAMVVLEEFVYFGDCWVIDFFEFVDLSFEQFAFVAADLVFVDDVDCADQPGFEVNGFAQLIELVLLQTW
jgi:hypothetical protein